MNEGLITSLNKMREMSVQSNSIYHQYVPIITSETDIGTFGTPILSTPVVMNEFMSMLVNRIVYTQFETKYFRNPLQVLEGDRIPLGYAGQEIYVNPAKGRQYNVNDFAGLLQKYEADVKVQYTSVNSDLQYPVTVTRHKLKQAFVSWDSLERFIDELSNSLYNGAYIDEYRFTKELISGAYKSNSAQIRLTNAVNTRALAREFTVQARTLFLNMQSPSTEYNSWSKLGGYGKPVTTWTNPEDIVFIIRNDIRSYLDVMSLANAFNLDKATLLGNIITVDNFDQYDDDGNKIFDGSNIVGFIGDKSWFRIKRQDMYLDEFYNANNRTWQYYLNLTKMYNYSLFANGVILATEAPSVSITSMKFVETGTQSVTVGGTLTLNIETTPITANSTITYSDGDSGEFFTAQAVTGNNKQVVITGVKAGTSKTLTASAESGVVTATITVNVVAGT